MPSPVALDAAGVFETLHRHGVQYIVIGGMAAAAGGVVWTTFDVDIVVQQSDDNLDALARAFEVQGRDRGGVEQHRSVPEREAGIRIP